MSYETNQELTDRHEHVKTLVKEARIATERQRIGTGARMRKARWAGCLFFTQLQIEGEMRERGLLT